MIMTSEERTRLDVHEAVCAERYRIIQEVLMELKEHNKETKRILWAVAGALLLAFLTVVTTKILGA